MRLASVFHYIHKQEGTPGADDVLGLNNAIITVLVPALAPLATGEWVAECVTTSKISPSTPGQTTSVVGGGGGTLGDGSMPANRVWLVSLDTGQAAPRNKGRIFMSGWPMRWEHKGNLTHDQIQEREDLLAVLVNNMTDAFSGHVYRQGNWSGDPPIFVDWLSGHTDGKFRTLRNRTNSVCG